MERSTVELVEMVRLLKELLARFMASFEASGVRSANQNIQAHALPQQSLTSSQLNNADLKYKGAELGSFACRILVVGDQTALAEHFTAGLSDYGHQIFLVGSDPRQLVGQIGSCLPAVVIIQTAPGVPGFLAGCSLAGCIRALPFVPQPLIFIYSSVEDGICRQEAQVSGVDHFLKVAASCGEIAQLVRQSILRPRRTFTTDKQHRSDAHSRSPNLVSIGSTQA